MKSLEEIKHMPNLMVQLTGADGGTGLLYLNGTKAKPATVVWSNGMGWEHVSVAFANRTPTWDEMSKVKDMFWHEDETVVQFHPKKSEYVNIHPYCLHLWRKKGEEYKLPEKFMI